MPNYCAGKRVQEFNKMYDFDNVVDFDEYRLRKFWDKIPPDTHEYDVLAALHTLYINGDIKVSFVDNELFVHPVSGSHATFESLPGCSPRPIADS